MYPDVDQLVGVFGREDIAALAQRLATGLNEQRTIFRPAHAGACLIPIACESRPAPGFPQDFRGLQPGVLPSVLFRKCAASTPASRWKGLWPRPRNSSPDGAKELVVVAQDTTFYGLDFYGKPRLDDLLRRLECIEGLPVAFCASCTSTRCMSPTDCLR